ncbi:MULTISPECIES: hypothetical protein [Enterobacter]|nr:MULTISPECIES: hypothetical protein [Enterobacter]CAE7591773.1 hypothetical protein AI2762V1_1168 [Enterobacter cloacae]ELE9721578.1 hypothetical protein [Enterobacter kobei]ELE9726120.1 hypothetical protein [Enterobacter kobei]MDU2819884.1 hypothetical protein [Enterobacter sp.]CAH3571122.1 hypothetical protein AI2762V1_1168 [Enterobacter cloacae]
MKLIDILVQELPERGGWPHGSERCMQTDGLYVTFPDIGDHCDFVAKCMAEGVRIATREQYEAAIAAYKPEWDGEGLPPVGSKVSFFYNERYDYNKNIIPQDGQELEVVAHKTTTDENDVAVCYWDKNGGGMAVCLVPGSLRPIRSEAEKKRDATIEAMMDVGLSLPAVIRFTRDEMSAIYDAIKSGKIVID